MQDEQFDFLVAGAGPVGCVVAERLSNKYNQRVLVIDKRNHIGGNCYDYIHKSGVLVHKYGPHYFRTNNRDVITYLSHFTDWIDGHYYVKSFVNGRLYSFPININTLEHFYNKNLNETEAGKLLDSVKCRFDKITNSEELVLSTIGEDLYRAFYLNYTLKQWNIHPKNLDAGICGRIPVRLNRDDRYTDHEYQVMPREGYTSMFAKMLDNKNISVQLNTDYMQIRDIIKPRSATVYCGALDRYFNNIYGKLLYRSLEFELKTVEQEYVQPCVQINYPNDNEYTRTVEIKHVTKQQHPCTVISYEFPKAEGEEFYPVNTVDNNLQVDRYLKLADIETNANNVYFAGRLAKYKYIDMDKAFEEGLALSEKILKDIYD